MSTFAIAHIKEFTVNADTTKYLQRIDATLEPYQGSILVHGGEVERLEGNWSGDLVILEFADRKTAKAWYDSAAYREIVSLRTSNMAADVIFVDRVPLNYRAAEILG